MSCSVAISSFLRHEVSFWVCGSAILILRRKYSLGIAASAKPILSAIVFVKGRALSAILILRRESIRQWLSAFGISLHRRLSSQETIVTGDLRHRRVSCLSSWTAVPSRHPWLQGHSAVHGQRLGRRDQGFLQLRSISFQSNISSR